MEATKTATHRRRTITTARHDVPSMTLYAITPKVNEQADCVLPKLPTEVLVSAMHYAEQSVAAGDGIKNEDIEDFVAAKLGWN